MLKSFINATEHITIFVFIEVSMKVLINPPLLNEISLVHLRSNDILLNGQSQLIILKKPIPWTLKKK